MAQGSSLQGAQPAKAAESQAAESEKFATRWEEHDFQVLKAFADEFRNESDRAAVILGAARLDMLLYQILAAFLMPSASSKEDELLDGDHPLGTFSARISAAYRLALIDAQLAGSLHLIRRIRNSFAHEHAGVTLETGPHRDRIVQLIIPLRSVPGYESCLGFFSKDQKGYSAEFRAAVGYLAVRLEALLVNASRVDDFQMCTLIPDSERNAQE
jgi:hypothetical protein